MQYLLLKYIAICNGGLHWSPRDEMLVSPSDPEGSSGAFGLVRRDRAGVGHHPKSIGISIGASLTRAIV